MMRPKSIAKYEICYLGAVLLGLAATAMSWSAISHTDDFIKIQQLFGSSFMSVFYVFVYALSLLLWYFTARSPNGVARWIVVIWLALSVIAAIVGIAKGGMPTTWPGLLSTAAIVLNAVAVWLLFRPDARAWFGERA